MDKIKMTKEEKDKLIQSKVVINREELCFVLGISYLAIMRLERDGVPHFKIGRRPYFFYDLIDNSAFFLG